MVTVKSIRQTCGACPAQWEGVTTDGRAMYVRYRWGWLDVDVADTIDNAVAQHGETVFSAQVGDAYDGFMSYDELVAITRDVAEWPTSDQADYVSWIAESS